MPFAALSTDPAAGVGIFAALAAGVVSFLSPCVLPLVPGYLSAVSGVSAAELETAGWRRILAPSLLFVASFSAIFVAEGLTATALGSAFQDHEELLTKIAAALIIAMGVLFVAQLFITRLNREWHVDALLERAGRGGPIVAGAAFAIAWTPCIGPTLGAILTAASLSGSAAHGALLLVVYSAGLAIPFLLTAIAFSRMTTAFTVVKRHYQAIVATGGVILIAMGVLIWTNELTQLNSEARSLARRPRPRLSGTAGLSCHVDDGHGRLDLLADRLGLFEPLAVDIARADDAEAARADLGIWHDREAADVVPAQPFDLERVHPHLSRREGAAGVVLVDRLGDRLEVLRLRRSHLQKSKRPARLEGAAGVVRLARRGAEGE